MITQKDFLEKIRTKYPQYNGIEDNLLFNKMIEKFPQYKEQIEIENIQPQQETGFLAGVKKAQDVFETYNPAGMLMKQGREIGEDIIDAVPKIGTDIMKIKNQSNEDIAFGKPLKYNEGEEPGFIAKSYEGLVNRERNFRERKEEQGDTGSNNLEKTADYLGQGAGLVSDIFGQAFVSGIQTLATEDQETAVKEGAKSIIESELGQEGIAKMQEGMESFAEWEAENPRTGSQLRNLTNMGLLGLDVAGLGVAKAGTKVVKEGVKDGIQATKQGINTIKTAIPKIVNKGKVGIEDLGKGIKQTTGDIYNKGGELIEEGTEKIAGKVLGSKTGNKELFQSASPSYATLGKDKNIKNLGKNLEKADKTVLKYGHTPTNTETRALAYKDSMKKVWKQVDEARGGTPTKVDAGQFADEIENFINTKKINGQINPEHITDINALEKQAEYFRNLGQIDVPTLGQIRADLNAMTSFKVQNPFGDVYNTGLKDIGGLIRGVENSTIESFKGTKFGNLMQEYRALAEMYPDIIKANIKNMRAKGASFEESFSRISGVGDILKGGLDLVTKGQAGAGEVAKGIGKVALGKVYGKLKDPDYLVKEGYKKLSKSLTPKKKTNVPNMNNSNNNITKYSKKSTKNTGGNKERLALPQKTTAKKSPIITPKSNGVTVAKDGTLEMKGGKYGKGGFINPTAINKDIAKLKIKTPAVIKKVTTSIVEKLGVAKEHTKEVYKIVEKYVKKYGVELKDKLGDLADELADKLGVRLKFIDDSGKSLESSSFHTSSKELGKLDDSKILWTTDDLKYSKQYGKKGSRLTYNIDTSNLNLLDGYNQKGIQILEKINAELPKNKQFLEILNKDGGVSSFFIQDKLVLEKLKKMGYDAIKTSESYKGGIKSIGIINPSKIKKIDKIPSSPLIKEAKKIKSEELDKLIQKSNETGKMPLNDDLIKVLNKKPSLVNRKKELDSIKEIIKKNTNIKDYIPNKSLSSIEKYTKHQGRINSYLRNPQGNHLKETVKLAVEAEQELGKFPNYNGTSYRGSKTFDGLENLKEGDIFSDKAFLSSSKEKMIADRFADDVLFIIKGKYGRDIEGISKMKSEKEILFKPNTDFKVISITEKGGKKIITLEQ